MDSRSALKLLASVLRGIGRHEWMAAGAMLACVAVVLNVSPFARIAKRDVARAEPAAELAAVAGSHPGPTNGERGRLGMEALAISEALRPVISVSAIPDSAF